MEIKGKSARRDRHTKLLLSEPCPVCDQLVAAWMLKGRGSVPLLVDEDLTQRPCLSFPQPSPDFVSMPSRIRAFRFRLHSPATRRRSGPSRTEWIHWRARQHTAIRYCCPVLRFEVELRPDCCVNGCGTRFRLHLPFWGVAGYYGFFRSIDSPPPPSIHPSSVLVTLTLPKLMKS